MEATAHVPTTPTVGPFRVLGRVIEVASTLEDIVHEVDHLLSPFRLVHGSAVDATFACTEDTTSSTPTYTVLRDGLPLWCTHDRSALVDGLLHHVHHLGLSALGPDHIPVHAGAVIHRGVGVLLPGASGAGKTTLVAALVRSGATYVTDEVALLDTHHGRLYPYPRALRFTPRGLDLFPDLADRPGRLPVSPSQQRYVLPQDLGPRASVLGPAGSRVGLVVLLQRTGAGGPPVRLTRGTALAELTRHCVAFGRHGGTWLPVLGRVLRGADPFLLDVGDLDDAVQEIARLVDGHRGARQGVA